MSSEELKKLKAELPAGGLLELAVFLKCDPSKITKAFYGLVKSPDFMARLTAKANEIKNRQTVTSQ